MDTNNNVDLSDFVSLSPVNSGIGPRSTKALLNFTLANGFVINTLHVNRAFVWVNTLKMFIDPQFFNFTVVPGILNKNFYTVELGTSHTNKIYEFKYSRMIFDETVIESRVVYYVEAGVAEARNGVYAEIMANFLWKSEF